MFCSRANPRLQSSRRRHPANELIALRTSCLPEAPHAEDEKAEGDVVDLHVFVSLQPSHVDVSEGSNARSVLHLLHAV